jgi:REP-associated tyrosine transposase
VQDDGHVLTVLRYVERNALGAGLVERAEQWRWGGLWARRHGNEALKAILAPWPIERPTDWLRRVSTPLSARELKRLRMILERDQPDGEEARVKRTAMKLGLEHTIRPEGRPPKRSEQGDGATAE